MRATPPLPAYWLTRLYLACSVLSVTFVSLFEADSLLYKIIQRSDDAGWWCVLALATLAGLAVVDTVVNDLMSDKFTLVRTRNNRHLLYMVLAIGMTCLAYIIAKYEGASYLLVRPCLDAGIATCVAYCDLFARRAKRKAAA